MKRSLPSSLAGLLSSLALLAGCGSDAAKECATPRIWTDSLGEGDERARIQVQWARIRGGIDSLASDAEGKRILDRAAGSLERNESRYRDSLVGKDGVGRSADGCVDWQASWGLGAFDRQAMATVLVRRLTPDTGFGAVEVRPDTGSRPLSLVVEASPGVSSPGRTLGTFTFRFDSTRIHWVRP